MNCETNSTEFRDVKLQMNRYCTKPFWSAMICPDLIEIENVSQLTLSPHIPGKIHVFSSQIDFDPVVNPSQDLFKSGLLLHLVPRKEKGERKCLSSRITWFRIRSWIPILFGRFTLECNCYQKIRPVKIVYVEMAIDIQTQTDDYETRMIQAFPYRPYDEDRERIPLPHEVKRPATNASKGLKLILKPVIECCEASFCCLSALQGECSRESGKSALFAVISLIFEVVLCTAFIVIWHTKTENGSITINSVAVQGLLIGYMSLGKWLSSIKSSINYDQIEGGSVTKYSIPWYGVVLFLLLRLPFYDRIQIYLYDFVKLNLNVYFSFSWIYG